MSTGMVAASALPCLPPTHLPANLLGPQAPDIVCTFSGPSGLQGYLADDGGHQTIYYTAGPHAQVLFRGPLYDAEVESATRSLQIKR
ncbi:hypothetical protein Acaty_m0158 (plasmid) [Acidithiobacillus caldus ATCC 51756]|uniref:Uncharacterized protein n=1 Tax=Acidithiobacillus caldus (strain ATCC 51756 / DSM 8584 / KU) TaxID=637389 RepID=A0A060A3H1_ACICK|nr:hypothetical protein Acaty_m0158 [Acidithiobacillus caldus ATCC 51756]